MPEYVTSGPFLARKETAKLFFGVTLECHVSSSTVQLSSISASLPASGVGNIFYFSQCGRCRIFLLSYTFLKANGCALFSLGLLWHLNICFNEMSTCLLPVFVIFMFVSLMLRIERSFYMLELILYWMCGLQIFSTL